MSEDLWWERRRTGEATAAYLARVLRELGAEQLAEDAARCHYDEFLCPPAVAKGMPVERLMRDVEQWGDRDQTGRVYVVLKAVRDGEFEGTVEEANAWASSPDGQEALSSLRRLNTSDR